MHWSSPNPIDRSSRLRASRCRRGARGVGLGRADRSRMSSGDEVAGRQDSRSTRGTDTRSRAPLGHRVNLANCKNGRMALQRMDNVGIVVESLDAAISFFAELGLELEGRAMIEGDWSGRVTGLRDQRVEIAMMRTPDGHGQSRPLAVSRAACGRRSPERPGERSGLPACHVRRGRPRRCARPAPRPRRAARRRSGPVRRRVSALLRPGPEGILIGLAEQNPADPTRAQATFPHPYP